MKINFSRCNNIDEGAVELRGNLLNIKYAINGTGKSTIVKSIRCAISDLNNGGNKLLEVTPFKHLNTKERPEVHGIDTLGSIKVFDENYINDFAFQADELIKGSFDIFIRDEEYEKGITQINQHIDTIKQRLSADEEIEALIQDFTNIVASFGRETREGIHGSSQLAKAFKDGNKISNIPAGLEPYESFIKHVDCVKWIKWQTDGISYMDIGDNCPFCTNTIHEKKETINKVKETYEPRAIESLNKIVTIFESSGKYFTEATQQKIDEFVRNANGYSPQQAAYLQEVKNQISNFKDLFVNAKNLGFQSFKDGDKAVDALKQLYIDLQLFSHLQSEETARKTEIINEALREVISNAGRLQGAINIQKRHIETLVNQHKTTINNFLQSAGYNYRVDLIEDKNKEHKLKLIHNDVLNEVTNAKSHLSYGEKNAFALILFMFDALKENPGLIVLDDPISSFDKNKKYAIIDMLFRKERSFKDKTVLLLTHDLDPIVDMMIHSDRFTKPFVSFLENKNGTLSEIEITKEKIQTYVQINNENLRSDINEISKLVYLRRLLELEENKPIAYQLVSNLLHRRKTALFMSNEESRALSQEEIEEATAQIKFYLPEFDYQRILTIVLDNEKLKDIYNKCASNYEKLHIYRIMFEGEDKGKRDDIIHKFINEAFHIENNYIYQLNPCHFQLVPQFVINECDKYIEASAR